MLIYKVVEYSRYEAHYDEAYFLNKNKANEFINGLYKNKKNRFDKKKDKEGLISYLSKDGWSHYVDTIEVTE